MAQITSAQSNARSHSTGSDIFAQVQDISKNYGSTQALRSVDLTINTAEILGLVGHNGAGKSTLVRVIAGLEQPDSGKATVGSHTVGADWSLAEAENRGVRMAYQELSLCNDLTVAESGYLSDRTPLPRFAWRKASKRRIGHALGEIFPNHGISLDQRIGDLSMAQRQMVEIARATCTDKLRLLILDEPSESLGPDAAEQMYTYLRKLPLNGTSVLLISHRMQEVLKNSSRIAVLKDGSVVQTVKSESATEQDLITAMGGELGVEATPALGISPSDLEQDTVGSDFVDQLDIRLNLGKGNGTITGAAGEIIGLAGLAGQGQEAALGALWRPGLLNRGIRIPKNRAYVPGDRQSSGILRLWSVAENLTISSVRSVSKFGVINPHGRSAIATKWINLLKIKGHATAPITTLSGGNQQKVLVARAFASDAQMVLLDDPFRGVDVKTKEELYTLMKSEAARGRTIVWYSTENQEMLHCDRVHVFRAGRIVSELIGPAITEERLIAHSFDDSLGELS